MDENTAPVATADNCSVRTQNIAQRMARAAMDRADNSQILGFCPREFVVFGLPYRDPHVPVYQRRNGSITFAVTAGAGGIPYGQDRLLVIWLATVFKLCGSPETNAIAFDSLRSLAETLGKKTSAAQLKRITQGLLRLFDASYLATDSRPGATLRERYQLMRVLRLAKDYASAQPNQHALWPNLIVYDPVFANDIRTGAVPTDFQSVRALSETMGALSLYQYEAYQSYLLARHSRADRAVPVLGANGLLAQLGGAMDANDRAAAKALVRHWHGMVKALWPQCPNELRDDGTHLILRPGYAVEHARIPSPEEFRVRPVKPELLERLLVGPAVIERRRLQAPDQ